MYAIYPAAPISPIPEIIKAKAISGKFEFVFLLSAGAVGAGEELSSESLRVRLSAGGGVSDSPKTWGVEVGFGVGDFVR